MSLSKTDEQILVVKESLLFSTSSIIQGFVPCDFSPYLSTIEKHKEFLPRQKMEESPSYKQIIPYLVFQYQNSLFVMQRKAEASEQRLKNKLSIGIGGHIRKEDMEDANIFGWAAREFDEEVSYQGTYHVKPLGIVNDDSNDVGKVHAGFVFLLAGSSDQIFINTKKEIFILL